MADTERQTVCPGRSRAHRLCTLTGRRSTPRPARAPASTRTPQPLPTPETAVPRPPRALPPARGAAEPAARVDRAGRHVARGGSGGGHGTCHSGTPAPRTESRPRPVPRPHAAPAPGPVPPSRPGDGLRPAAADAEMRAGAVRARADEERPIAGRGPVRNPVSRNLGAVLSEAGTRVPNAAPASRPGDGDGCCRAGRACSCSAPPVGGRARVHNAAHGSATAPRPGGRRGEGRGEGACRLRCGGHARSGAAALLPRTRGGAGVG